MSASSSTNANANASTNANVNTNTGMPLNDASSIGEFSPSVANQILSVLTANRPAIGSLLNGNCLSVWTRSKDRSLRMKLVNGRIRFYLVCGNSVSCDGESSISEAGRIASVYVNRYGILDR